LSVDGVAVNVTTAVPLQAASTKSVTAVSGAITQWRNAGRTATTKQALKEFTKEFMMDRGSWNPAGIVHRISAREKRPAGKYL
jgi:hypothetical protein